MGDRACIYGINDYKHVSDLGGCINDVHNMRDLLVDQFEFKPKHIRTRVNQEVVLEQVLEDFEWLIANPEAGDRRIFHFSGHGTYMADADGDEEDGVDEVLCLYDHDFNDPGTYLDDDRIRELTQRIPRELQFTFILDCCHSGTGTRSLRAPSVRRGARWGAELPLVIESVTQNRADRAEVREARGPYGALGRDEDVADPAIALARFVSPPAHVERIWQRHGVRKRVGATVTDMNHVSFGGCRDDQTSADAPIDGDRHGAFTYYFCSEVRKAGPQISQQALIERVRQVLRREGFEQVPQLRPKNAGGPVFGGSGDDGRVDDSGYVRACDFEALVRRVERLERAPGEADSDGERQSAIGERAIVYVHGICWHDRGFSDPWYESLRPHLDEGVEHHFRRNRHEVLWSRHVSSGRDAAVGRTSRSTKEQDLADQIADVLRDRASQLLEAQAPRAGSEVTRSQVTEGDIDRALLGIPGLDCVDDFIKYLLRKKTRQAVVDEFVGVVQPLLAEDRAIEVVSHSWGTVVALEALHFLSREAFPGRVHNLFTFGAALSVGPVQRRLEFGAETGERPALVDNWVNLDARGDIVGGTLRGLPFAVDREFLNLEPIGCSTGFFGVSPSCAHSSYFVRDNVAVHRDICARFVGEL